jgi:hypothetical protein
MKCGAKAVSHQTTTFAWAPQWIGWVLGLTIVAGMICVPVAIILRLVMTKRMRVDVPLCARHQNPWLLSLITMWGGLTVLVVLAVATAVLVALWLNKLLGSSLEALPILTLVATLFYFPVWAVIASIIAQRTIHASLITPEEIRLVSVSRPFADAVYEEEDDAFRRRQSRRAPARRVDKDEPEDGYTDRRGER